MERDLKQEFRDLLENAGWTQSKASQELGITRGAVSQIWRTNSPVKPSLSTLKFLKMLVEKPATAREQWESDLLCAVRRVAPTNRQQLLRYVHALIDVHLPPR